MAVKFVDRKRAAAVVDSLLAGPNEAEVKNGLMEVDLANLAPSPYQFRTEFAQEALEELASSIRAEGVVVPIIITQSDRAGIYWIVSGERRWRASRLAGKTTIPAVERQYNTEQLAMIGLIDNVQRVDLSPIEEAEGFRRLVEEFGWTHEEVARRAGKSRATVTRGLQLIELPKPVKDAVSDGKLSAKQAHALTPLMPDADDPDKEKARKQLIKVSETAIRNGWNSDQIAQRAKEIVSEKIAPDLQGEIGVKPNVHGEHFEEKPVVLSAETKKLVRRLKTTDWGKVTEEKLWQIEAILKD